MRRYFLWLMVLIILVGMNAVRTEAAPVSYDFSGDFYWGTYAPGGESFTGTISYDDVSLGNGSLTLRTSLLDWSGNASILNYGAGYFLSVYDKGVSITLDLFISGVAPYGPGYGLYFGESEFSGGNYGYAAFTAVPEPGTLLLLGFALIGLAGFVFCRKK